MDILNKVNGILYCSVECAYEHEPSTDTHSLTPVDAADYDRPLWGCYCPNCLSPFEGFTLNPEGGTSSNAYTPE